MRSKTDRELMDYADNESRAEPGLAMIPGADFEGCAGPRVYQEWLKLDLDIWNNHA